MKKIIIFILLVLCGSISTNAQSIPRIFWDDIDDSTVVLRFGRYRIELQEGSDILWISAGGLYWESATVLDSTLFDSIHDGLGRFCALIDSGRIIDSSLSLDDLNWEGGLTDSRIDSLDPDKLEQDGATTGQPLEWDGSKWAPGTDNTGTASLEDVFNFMHPDIFDTTGFNDSIGIKANGITDGMVTDALTVTGYAPLASPTFTTDITTPLVIGGTATTSDLSLKTTSGVGETGADMHFLVGNNGATEAMTILNNGNVGIGTISPSEKLEINTGKLKFSGVSQSAGWHSYEMAMFLNRLTLSGDVYFFSSSYSGSEGFIWNSTNKRIGIGTSAPKNALDVEGAAVIGAAYSGTKVAPSNGLLVQGTVGISTNVPPQALSVVGNIATGDTATGDVDVYHYFSTNGSWTTEYFKWDDGNSRFEVSDDLDVTGNITVTGTVDTVDVGVLGATVPKITDDTTDFKTAFGWGDHSAQGYLNTLIGVFAYFDRTYFDTVIDASGDSIVCIYSDSTDLSIFDTDDLAEGFNKYDKALPDSSEWSEAYDSSQVGYLNPADANVDTAHWNAAWVWGDHSGEGYITNSKLSDSSITLLNATAWRLFYSNATTTAIQELALGSDGTYLKSNGASSAPTWATPGAGLSYWTESDDNDTSVFTATAPNTTVGFSDNLTMQGNDIIGVGMVDGTDVSMLKDTVDEWDNRGYPDASTTEKGIASFSSGNFDVTSGEVSIKLDGIDYLDIKAGAVRESELATNAVTLGKMADNSVGCDELGANVVHESELASIGDVAVDEDIVTFEETGNKFEYHTPAELGLADTSRILLTDRADTNTGGIVMSGANISMAGAETVDDIDISEFHSDYATDSIKLYGIESGATADQTVVDSALKVDTTAYTNVWVHESGDTMSGNLHMNENKVTGLPTPVDDGDAASKGYVDSKGIADTTTRSLFVSGTIEGTGELAMWNYRHDLDTSRVWAPNADTFALIPIPEACWTLNDSNRWCAGHPGVIFAPMGRLGYQEWMVMTPFDDSCNEDVCIRVKNVTDTSWNLFISGTDTIADPIFEESDLDASYLSDPDMFFTHDGKIGILMRAKYTLGDSVKIWLAVSSDGLSWDTTSILSDSILGFASAHEFLSPSIILDTNGTYTIWAVESNGYAEGDENTVVMYKAPKYDSGWYLIDTVDWEAHSPGLADIWHIDVLPYGPDQLVGIVYECDEDAGGTGTQQGDLYLSLSSDGGNTWTTRNTPFLRDAGSGCWDGDYLYRASGYWIESGSRTQMALYYGGFGGAGSHDRHTGYTVVTFGDTTLAVYYWNLTYDSVQAWKNSARFMENSGDTVTGRYDLGGAVLEIPNSDNPTVDADGETAWENDDNCLRTWDGSANRAISTVKFFSATIFNPELVQDTIDALAILPVEPEWAPFGIKLLDVGIKTDAASTYSVNFEEWTSPTDGSPSTIETVATSSSTEAEDDGTLTDSDIAAGSIIYIDLPDTDIKMLQVWGTYYIVTGD